jgi:methionyl-tRNA formyltransferase
MTRRPIRIVYFGTPAYAVPALQALADEPRFEVALVVTQPDRPAGRGRRPQAPPVKVLASALGLSLYQPESLRDRAAREPLVAVEADLFVVAAYGLIFGSRTLGLPRRGCVNLHASLLPAYRGASPVTAAILCGDQVTGVSLMLMETGLDTGPVIDRMSVTMSARETTESLTTRLGKAAARLAVASLDRFFSGDLEPRPQDAEAATTTRPLVKADGWLDWSETAVHLDRRVRAMWPWPRAWTTFCGEPLQVHRSTPLPHESAIEVGFLRVTEGELVVGTGTGALRLEVVQPAGGKPMPGGDWANGRRVGSGEALGVDNVPELPPPVVTRV